MRTTRPLPQTYLAPLIAVALLLSACKSPTQPAPTGVAALTAADRDKSTLVVTSAGTPTTSQTFQGGYTVNLSLASLSLFRASNGAVGGDVSLSASIVVPGQPTATGIPRMTLSCVVFAQRGAAVHVYAQGMAVDGPGAPPGVPLPAYIYLVDDPAGDQMWSGPLGALGQCAVPTSIVNPDGSTGPVSLRPVLNGSITVSVK